MNDLKPRPTKKTETIEVRVAPETKSALQDLSRREGRTVSEIVRGLIERRLARAAPSRLERFVISAANLKETLLQTPRSRFRACAAALAALGSGFAFVLTTSQAEDLSLDLSGSITERVGVEGKTEERKLATTVQLDFDENAVLRIAGDDGAIYSVDLRTSASGDDAFLLEIEVRLEREAESAVLATPKLLLNYGAASSVRISGAGSGPDIAFDVKGEKLSG